MSFRYSTLTKISKKFYRVFFPIPKSPWTIGKVEDICEIHLVPPEQLKTFFAQCYKKLQELKGKDIGDYLEFGVFNGSSLSSAYLTAQNMKLKKIRFFGFDAFEGLPAGAEKEDDGVWKKGFYACPFTEMKRCLKQKDINPEKITWIKGWYDKTLTQKTAKKHNIHNIGIAFVDCDTYSSSKAALAFLEPHLTQPAILCFDDWKLNDLDVKGMGEYKSFNEFLEKNTHLHAEEIHSYNRKSKCFLVRPKN